MLYKYGMRLRDSSIGCQPIDGLERVADDPTGRYHDILVYSHPLSMREMDEFELDYLGEVEA